MLWRTEACLKGERLGGLAGMREGGVTTCMLHIIEVRLTRPEIVLWHRARASLRARRKSRRYCCRRRQLMAVSHQ